MQLILEKNIEKLKRLCRNFKIKRLYAFGSAVSGDFTDDSDIDFLISFSESLTIEEYTTNYFELHFQLKYFTGTIEIIRFDYLGKKRDFLEYQNNKLLRRGIEREI